MQSKHKNFCTIESKLRVGQETVSEGRTDFSSWRSGFFWGGGGSFFKRENLTKRWFDQGTGWLFSGEWVLFRIQPKSFLKWPWPENGVYPKHTSFLHPVSIYYLPLQEHSVAPQSMASKIKSKFLEKAQTFYDPKPISLLWPYLLFSCMPFPRVLTTFPKYATHFHQGSSFNPHDPPCHHPCPPKPHISVGQVLFLWLYIELVLIAVHLFLWLDCKLLMGRNFLIHLSPYHQHLV